MKYVILLIVTSVAIVGCSQFCEVAPTVGYETGIFCDPTPTPAG